MCQNSLTWAAVMDLQCWKFETMSGIKVPYEIAARRAGDPAVLVASNKKAKELLGWKLVNSSLEKILETALVWEKNKRY